MHSLLCRLHLNDPLDDRSLAHGAEGTPLLNERAQRPPNPHDAAALGRPCTLAHEEALRLLSDIVQALATRPSVASPGRLFAPEMLALLGDLLDIRHIGCDVILLFTHVLSQGFRSSREVLTALTTDHGGRAPFLLRLSSAAVHDLALSMAMCELLTEFSHAIGRVALVEALLASDCAAGARTGATLPCGIKARHASFLGRLIGDGQGEWGNDGAVYAIGRMHDEDLLPHRGQVVHWRSHWGSRRRWEKQERFVAWCKDRRQRPPWQPPARPTLSFTAMSDRLAAMLGELSRAQGAARVTQGLRPRRLNAPASPHAPASACATASRSAAPSRPALRR